MSRPGAFVTAGPRQAACGPQSRAVVRPMAHAGLRSASRCGSCGEWRAERSLGARFRASGRLPRSGRSCATRARRAGARATGDGRAWVRRCGSRGDGRTARRLAKRPRQPSGSEPARRTPHSSEGASERSPVELERSLPPPPAPHASPSSTGAATPPGPGLPARRSRRGASALGPALLERTPRAAAAGTPRCDGGSAGGPPSARPRAPPCRRRSTPRAVRRISRAVAASGPPCAIHSSAS